MTIDRGSLVGALSQSWASGRLVQSTKEDVPTIRTTYTVVDYLSAAVATYLRDRCNATFAGVVRVLFGTVGI